MCRAGNLLCLLPSCLRVSAVRHISLGTFPFGRTVRPISRVGLTGKPNKVEVASLQALRIVVNDDVVYARLLRLYEQRFDVVLGVIYLYSKTQCQTTFI